MISACYIVHYGLEWLRWSIKSIVNYVDQVHIFYTPYPSHGYQTDMKCPESKLEIQTTCVDLFLNYSIYWHDCGRFANEGEHRAYAVSYCNGIGSDLVLVVDADELWPASVVQKALQIATIGNASSYRIGMRHFWRSVYWVCDDSAMPTRVLDMRNRNNPEAYLGDDVGKVFHMGYAQSPAIVEYKQSIHGHKADWRADWFTDKFLAWSPTNLVCDVHPTIVDYWNPKQIDIEEPADAFKELKVLCGDHPYWNKDIITNESFRS